MKQRITFDQFAELDEEIAHNLLVWCTKHGYDHMMYIGTMIEFLDEQGLSSWFNYRKAWYVNLDAKRVFKEEELCDALWEAVKEVLND